MAIYVTRFSISNDMLTLNLDVTVGSTERVTSIKLTNEKTYRNSFYAKDLSNKLEGTSNQESIVVSSDEIDISYFDGIYFMEIETSENEASMVAAANLTQYYVIQAKLVSNIDLSCLSCNTNFQNALLFDLYLEAMRQSLLLGRFRDAIDYLKKIQINLIEGIHCSECKDIPALVSTAGNIVSVGVMDCLLTEI